MFVEAPEKKSWVKTRKSWGERCIHPEHKPPGYICLLPGQEYVHTCPGCGKKTILVGRETFFVDTGD